MKPLKNSIENRRRFKDGDKSHHMEKNNFCKIGCLRIIFLEGKILEKLQLK